MTDVKPDDKTVDKKITDDPAFQEMQKAVKGIALLVQNQATASAKQSQDFTAALEKLAESKDAPKHIPLEDQHEAINDLDNMGLMSLVVKEVGKVVDDKLDSVTDTLKGTQQDLNDTRLAGQVKELMNDNPDFMDWKSEMAAIARDNPSLSIERIYGLAKMESPEKAAELTEKYTDADKKEDKGFLSLMPTGGAYDDSDEKPTKEEAGEKAWEETIAQFPGLAASGDA